MPGPSARPPVDPRMLRALAFEDLRVGMRETLLKTVMDTDVVGFARISGDDNPIHLCDTYAAGSRFGERIAHGLYTASLISAVLGTRLPGPGAVVELMPQGRKVRLACEASVDGRVVLDGEALVSVPARSA